MSRYKPTYVETRAQGGERVSAPVSVIPADSPCRTAILVPVELEQRLREAVSRCAASLGESPDLCWRAVEIAILKRGIEALEKEATR